MRFIETENIGNRTEGYKETTKKAVRKNNVEVALVRMAKLAQLKKI